MKVGIVDNHFVIDVHETDAWKYFDIHDAKLIGRLFTDTDELKKGLQYMLDKGDNVAYFGRKSFLFSTEEIIKFPVQTT